MVARLDRRQLLAGAAGGIAALGLGAGPVRAATPHYAAALADVLAGREPAVGGIDLELPEVAEDGNMVPVTVSVDSPMTEAAHVRQIVLLSTRNPTALVGRFHLTPALGRAVVGNRIRLAETQEVVAVAELSDGTLRQARRLVRVTVGGCGAPA
jgi:sulfur-oxidizing protein SoxY